MIPASFIQDLLSRVDVADVVGHHVTLKKAGINYKGLCPFHSEKSPSFIVSPTRQTYHCFGCGAHGDAIRFLVEHAGLGFVEAVQDLASQAGMSVPTDDRSPLERERTQAVRESQRQLSDVLAQAAHHYRQQLKKAPRAIDYLKERGLSGTIAARFGLGYAPAGWHNLSSAYPNYDDPLLVEAGLVIESNDSSSSIRSGGDASTQRKRYDRFRDRIMFPIRNVKGEVLGFGARVLDQGQPKYLNSPETPVFVKGKELYGLFEARTALRQAGYALVTEGYMDVVALAQHGIAHAVATLGTACSAEHVHKLLRFTDRVVFAFDGDTAGRRAAARALEAALTHATDTRSFSFLFLPAEHDPDSYVRLVGPQGFTAAVTHAVPLSKQLIELAAQGCGDLSAAEDRARMLAQARPLWSQLPEGVLKSQVLTALAAQGGMPVAELQHRWAASEGPRARTTTHRDATPRAPALSPEERQQLTPSTPPFTRRQQSQSTRWEYGSGSWVPIKRHHEPRQAPPNLLDRALLILLHRPSLWGELSTESQHRLAEQAPPYGQTFTWIEREASHADDLTVGDTEDALLAADHRSLISRVRKMHPLDRQSNLQQELHRLLEQLELREVGAELELLFESGDDLSPQAKARGQHLVQRQSHLKLSLQAPMESTETDKNSGKPGLAEL